MMKKPLAVVLVSGGMDSCVTAAIAREEYELAMLHANYGQRTERRELRAFKEIAEFFGVAGQLVIPLEHLSTIKGSSLTDPSIPVCDAELTNREIPTSYVPFRNANILAAAVSWAEVLAASAIFVGAVEEDASGYPDCRKEFFRAFSETIRIGTKPNTVLQIATPIIDMSKAEIVLRGKALDAPFHLTWSCYRQEDVACGTCDSCALRLRGFQIAGVDDPIPYDKKPMYPHRQNRAYSP